MGGKAVIVVDMINDFTTGVLGSEGARAIRKPLDDFLSKARKDGLQVIYVHDSHMPEDPEIPVWGEHGMRDTKGSEIDAEVSPKAHDVVMPKQFYDAFNETTLHNILRHHNVDEVIITGVSTDICVQHTAWGAFRNKIPATVLSDLTAAINEENHERGLDYMKTIYGTRIVTSDEVLEKLQEPTAAASR